MKSPLDLTFSDLAKIAEQASIKADKEARDARIRVAGLTRKPKAKADKSRAKKRDKVA